MLGGVDSVAGELPLPSAHTGRPFKAAVPHGRTGVPVRLLVEEHLEPVDFPVHLHLATLKNPALIVYIRFRRQLLDPFFCLTDVGVIVV